MLKTGCLLNIQARDNRAAIQGGEISPLKERS